SRRDSPSLPVPQLRRRDVDPVRKPVFWKRSFRFRVGAVRERPVKIFDGFGPLKRQNGCASRDQDSTGRSRTPPTQKGLRRFSSQMVVHPEPQTAAIVKVIAYPM